MGGFSTGVPTRSGPLFIPISHHPDQVVAVTRGYGKGQKPTDFLDSFTAFIKGNINKIAALKIVLQRPRDLTRAELKALRLALDALGYSEANLRRAWSDAKNEDIAASIIGFVRQAALGDALTPLDVRVNGAMQRILARKPWTEVQRKWLKRIEEQLLREVVVDRAAIDEEPFRADGGFQRLNKVFGGQLEAVLCRHQRGTMEEGSVTNGNGITREIVAKLWNLCNVLRDDGITYTDYVTELTFLLFLKMLAETGHEERLPKEYRWAGSASGEGLEQLEYYRQLLLDLGNPKKTKDQVVLAIFTDAQTKLRKPTNLKALTDAIDKLDWFSAREEGLGNLYEGLLEKNAAEKKSGAGQYFTPRPLIDCIVRLVKPQAGRGHAGPGRRHRRLSRCRGPLHQGPDRRSLQAEGSRRPSFSGTTPSSASSWCRTRTACA